MTRRILAAMLALTAALLVGLVVPLGLVTARHDRAVFVDRAAARAEGVATLVEEQLADGNQVGFSSAAQAAEPGSLSVFSAAAAPLSVFATLPTLAGPEVPAGLVRQALAGRPVHRWTSHGLLVVAPSRTDRSVVGAVALSVPAGPLHDQLTELAGALALAALAACAAAGGLGLALARWVERPLRRLDRVARRLGAGDLDARSELAGGPPEIVELSATLDDMAGRLQTLLAGQRNLLAEVSHQLRTPLAAARLRLELLGGGLPPEAADDLDGALSELGRLSRLVDGLLAVARAESSVPVPVPVAPGPVLADRVAVWQPLAAERDISLLAELGATTAAELPDVLASDGSIEQVLDNLLDNALDATPPGGQVLVLAHEEADGLLVQVRDSGPGMSPQAREHAFRRFWRGDPSRPGGSGLGLAIVHRLVSADGGRVSLSEAPGGGLCAAVTWRLAGAVRPATPSAAE